jgi:long-chain acyl-CoA synthetase
MVRPANTLKTLHDIVAPVSEPVQRSILDVPLTNDALTELLRLLPLGLRALFPLKAPEHKTTRPILVVLPPNPSTSLPLLLLALASSLESPIIVLPTPQLLIQALEETKSHPAPGIVLAHESIAEGVVEQVAEAMEGKCGVLIAGDTTRRLEPLGRKAARHGVDVRFWEDLWTAAEDVDGLDIASKSVTLPALFGQ